MAPTFLLTGPASAKTTLLLAHGAGAPMDSDWMNGMAEALAEKDIRVARFEFSYMAARREGQRKPPSPANILIGEYVKAIAALEHKGRLFIGGKSLGGRMASMIGGKLFSEKTIAGLVCLGYPFHPPGQREKLRTDHLEKLACPTLVCQGERDPFGTKDEVAAYKLSKAIELFWLTDGDHDLKPRKASGKTLADNVAETAGKIAGWVGG
jgi:predicted alpha/beta-hydrolase family hydrolase